MSFSSELGIKSAKRRFRFLSELNVFCVAVCIVLCGNNSLNAQTNGSDISWFPVGEKMSYKLYWGFIPVGRAELSSEWADLDGTHAIRLCARARTTSIVEKIYPVEDEIVSYVDPATFLPLVYTQKLREGRHKRDDHITFYRDKGIAVWKKLKHEVTQIKEIAIEQDTRDVLCLVYYMRKTGYAVGQQEFFKVIVDDKIYDLEVLGIAEETQKIKNMGKIKSLKVEPKAKFGGIFVRKGSVNLWFSLDPRHVCLSMSASVPVANLSASLQSVEGPGDDMWSRKGSDKENAE